MNHNSDLNREVSVGKASRLRVEMSSHAFRGDNGMRNLVECREVAAEYGWDFGVQLHNSCSVEEISTLVATGVSLSAHGPVNEPFNWNLAAASVEDTFESIARNVELFRKLGIVSCVFHGFCMTDRPVPAFGRGRSYDECMSTVFRPELAYSPAVRWNGRYTDSEEFLMRRDRLKKHLARLRKLYPDLMFCVENDFPSYGSSNMLGADAVALNNPICLDTGHLWMTCRLFERDFHEEVEVFLESGLVRMIHLHASKYTRSGYALEQWGDGHLPLSTPGEMNLPRFVHSCRCAGVRYFVLEIVQGTVADLRLLKRWLKA